MIPNSSRLQNTNNKASNASLCAIFMKADSKNDENIKKSDVDEYDDNIIEFTNPIFGSYDI
jgi:hypothetical protein